MGFLADPLSALMLLFVTFIGSLIHIYSVGYMAGDKNYGKFFCYMNLFLGSMLILVLGSGPVVMFVGWEGVGLCSYLLISFFSEDTDNVLAGNKAFIVNRIGDLGFVLGMSVLFWAIGSNGFDYLSLASKCPYTYPGNWRYRLPAALCRRYPVNRRRSLSMSGCPTPWLVLPRFLRLSMPRPWSPPVSIWSPASAFIYAHFPIAGSVVAWVGILTALLAAIFGMFQKDIKKILAYSTVSQLGYMFAAVGVTAYSAGIFHVFTHAFFKALLFLGAGSVIYALHHQQDIWKMGGLKDKLPKTYWTMLIGALALSGVSTVFRFFQ